MTRLVVTADAEADTTEILAYLQRKAGAPLAERYARRFLAAAQRIVEMPQSGAPRPALGPQSRCVIVPPYVLIYDYDAAEDLLVLLRILDGRRKISADTLGR